MSDPNEGSKYDTGRASGGGEVAAAGLAAKAGTSARRAPGFRKEFLSRTPFLMNPYSDGFAGDIRLEMDRRSGSSERSWRRFGASDGKPTDSDLNARKVF